MTRSAVSWLTRPRVSALSARETVPGCTWAARATSRSVTDDDRTAPLCRRLQADGGVRTPIRAAAVALRHAVEATRVRPLAADDRDLVQRLAVDRQPVAVALAVADLERAGAGQVGDEPAERG